MVQLPDPCSLTGEDLSPPDLFPRGLYPAGLYSAGRDRAARRGPGTRQSTWRDSCFLFPILFDLPRLPHSTAPPGLPRSLTFWAHSAAFRSAKPSDPPESDPKCAFSMLGRQCHHGMGPGKQIGGAEAWHRTLAKTFVVLCQSGAGGGDTGMLQNLRTSAQESSIHFLMLLSPKNVVSQIKTLSFMVGMPKSSLVSAGISLQWILGSVRE